MPRWKIPVTWEVCGFVHVDADRLEEAMDYVADNFEWDSDSTAVQLFENVLKRRFA